MSGMDLVKFLNARLDEDERAAKTMAEHYPAPWDVADRGWMARVVADEPNFREVTLLEEWPGMPSGEDAPWLGEIIGHIARHDPAHVLAEVEAKRRVVERLAFVESHGPAVDHVRALDMSTGAVAALRDVIAMLALPYADHPDYQQEWQP